MTNQIDYFKIWADGLPLNEAAWQFGLRQVTAEYYDLQATPIEPSASGESTQRLIEPSTTGRIAIVAAIVSALAEVAKPVLNRRDDLVRLQESQRQLLLQQLRHQRLLALGYTLPRNPADLPCPVLPDVFDPRFIDWHQSSIKGNGLHYVAVRAVRLGRRAQKLLTAQIADPNSPTSENAGHAPNFVQTKPQGRPSIAPIVTEAYQTLNEAGKICTSDSARMVHEKISTWIKARYPDSHVPKYGAVRRIIKPLRDRDAQ